MTVDLASLDPFISTLIERRYRTAKQNAFLLGLVFGDQAI